MMTSFRTILVALAILIVLQTSSGATEPPKAVQKWLKSQVGRWEIKGGLKPDQIGRHESELVAGGTVLLSRGTTGDGNTSVAVHAWESAKQKLVTTIYSSSGAYLRREQDVSENTIGGSVDGVAADGNPFKGHFTAKMSEDGSYESIYKGTLAGETVTLKWTSKRLPR